MTHARCYSGCSIPCFYHCLYYRMVRRGGKRSIWAVHRGTAEARRWKQVWPSAPGSHNFARDHVCQFAEITLQQLPIVTAQLCAMWLLWKGETIGRLFWPLTSNQTAHLWFVPRTMQCQFHPLIVIYIKLFWQNLFHAFDQTKYTTQRTMGFQVLTAVNSRITGFWKVMPCSLVERY